jgi:hypothetical protein
MTPTPEQVAAWAREAGLTVGRKVSGIQLVGAGMHGARLIHLDIEDIHRIATRAFTEGRVYQAEQDAAGCQKEKDPWADSAYDRACEDCAAAIRANAPKGVM